MQIREANDFGDSYEPNDENFGATLDNSDLASSGLSAVGDAAMKSAASAGGLASGFGFAAAGIQILSGLKQAQQIEQQAELTNKLNEINAKYEDLNAFNALKEGYSEAASYQTTINKTISGQQGAFASEDVAVGYGTAAQVQKDTQNIGLSNQLQMIAQARNKAMGYTQRAQAIRYGETVNKSQSEISADTARLSGALQGLQTGVRAWSTDSNNPNSVNLGSSNYSRF